MTLSLGQISHRRQLLVTSCQLLIISYLIAVPRSLFQE